MSWKMRHQSVRMGRQLQARCLGPGLEGSVPPIPQSTDGESYLLGCFKRIGMEMPTRNTIFMKELRNFVRKFLKSHGQVGAAFEPLPATYDYAMDTWLAKTHYSEARKEEIRAAAKDKLTSKDFECNSFVKVEFLEDWKHDRIINSRTDAFKAFSGPLFHAIEERVFKSQHFIKRIPMDQRWRFLSDRLAGSNRKYAVSDYSSFEANITSEMMDCCEFQLYAHMLKNHPKFNKVYGVLREALSGVQVLRSKFGAVKTTACRMSGDMCTSLGNGFTNLMVNLFVFSQFGYQVDGVFEGDDGLMSFCKGNGRLPTKDDYGRLGTVMKLRIVDNLSDAEFCGMYAHKDVLDNVGDVGYVLRTFGWTTSNAKAGGIKMMKQLLRAKAYSLTYEMPRCPVLRALADYALRVTADVTPRFDVNKYGALKWWDQQISELFTRPLPDGTVDFRSRQFVEERFGISVALQHKYEQYLAQKNDLDMIPDFGLPYNKVYADNWARFVRVVPPGLKDRLVTW